MSLSTSLIIFGIGLIIVGILVWLGLPFGKMPGDIRIEGEKTSVYIPIVTSILISVVLTIIVNVIFWLMRK